MKKLKSMNVRDEKVESLLMEKWGYSAPTLRKTIKEDSNKQSLTEAAVMAAPGVWGVLSAMAADFGISSTAVGAALTTFADGAMALAATGTTAVGASVTGGFLAGAGIALAAVAAKEGIPISSSTERSAVSDLLLVPATVTDLFFGTNKVGDMQKKYYPKPEVAVKIADTGMNTLQKTGLLTKPLAISIANEMDAILNNPDLVNGPGTTEWVTDPASGLITTAAELTRRAAAATGGDGGDGGDSGGGGAGKYMKRLAAVAALTAAGKYVYDAGQKDEANNLAVDDFVRDNTDATPEAIDALTRSDDGVRDSEGNIVGTRNFEDPVDLPSLDSETETVYDLDLETTTNEKEENVPEEDPLASTRHRTKLQQEASKRTKELVREEVIKYFSNRRKG